jgi:hypothetical protein
MTSTGNSDKRPVTVGTRVRILAVSGSLLADLPADDVQQLRSMLGDVLEIDEIDEHGRPWVTKWFGDSRSHSLALDDDEFEIVE